MQKTNQNSTTNMARRTFGAAFLLLFFGLPAGAQNNAAPDIYHLVSGNPQLGEDRREAIDTNPAPDDWEAQLEAITEGATPDIVSSEEAFTEIGDPAEPEPLQHAPQSFTLDRNGVPVPSAVTEAMEADVYTMEGLERTLGDVDEELGPGLEQIFRPDQRQEIYDPAAAAQRQAQEEAQDEWQVKEKIKETAEKMQSLPEYQVEQALQQELSLEEALTPLLIFNDAESSPGPEIIMEEQAEDDANVMAAVMAPNYLRSSAKQEFDWANLEGDKFWDFQEWLRDLQARKNNPYWAGNRSYADHELMGFVLDVAGPAWRYTQKGHNQVHWRTPLYETDEVVTGPQGHLWLFLVDGTMVRLAPNSSLSLQEIDVGIKENFLYARINYGNVAWLSRNDGLFVPQAKAETDALFLPLKMNEANFILPDQMTTEDNLAFYLDQENLYREVYHRLNKLITANNQWIDRPTYSFLVMPNGVMWGKNLMLEAVVYLGGDSYLKALDFSFYQPPLPAPKGADIAATRLAQPPGEELSPLALAAQEKGNLINQEAEAASDAESVGDDQAEEAESTKNDSTSPPPSSSEEAVTYNPPQHRPQARFYFRKIAAQVPQEIEYNQWYRVDRLSSQLEPQESTQELNFDLLEFPILRIPTIFTARELWLAQRPTKIFTQPLRAEVLAQAPRYRLWGELSRDRLSDAEADDAAEDEAPSLSASGAATPSPAPVPAGKKSPSVVGDDNLQQRLDFLKKYVMRIEMSTLYKLDMYQKQLAREGKQFILDIPGLTKMPKFSDFYQESIRAFGNQANHMALELEQEDRRLNSTQQDWWRNYRIKHHR